MPMTDDLEGMELIGQVAAKLMDNMEAEGEPRKIISAMVIVEVVGDDQDGEGPWSNVEFQCSDGRTTVQTGLLHRAIDIA